MSFLLVIRWTCRGVVMRVVVILGVFGDFLGVVGVVEGRGIRRGRSLRPKVTKNGYLLMFSIILFA